MQCRPPQLRGLKRLPPLPSQERQGCGRLHEEMANCAE
jgi:hypothetical protein